MSYSRRHIIDKLLEWTFNGFVAALPNRLLGSLRVKMLRKMGAQIGDRVKLSRKIKVLGARTLRIEDGCAVAHSVVLDARGGLTIHTGALIGFESVLLTYTHAWPDPSLPVHKQGVMKAPVEIGPLSWLGARTFVLPGVTIGASTVVGAGSVVSKSIAAMTVAAGVPAREVGARRDRSQEKAD